LITFFGMLFFDISVPPKYADSPDECGPKKECLW